MRKIWFGTRELMQWVAAPAINYDGSKAGWATEASYLNGGFYSRRSVASHKTYSLSWSLADSEEVRPIADYADGLFGDGLIYWADPFAVGTNMLPSYWAAPFMGAHDGPILTGDEFIRPTLTPTPTNPNNYPVQSAEYNLSTAGERPRLWVPIPPGYTAWVGVHGSASGGGVVRVTPSTGPLTSAAPQAVTMQSVSATSRFSASFSSALYDGIEISLGATGTVVLSGLMVQVLKTGITPAAGGKFISGQGNSGCRFTEQPELTQFSAALDKVSLTAELAEVGAWL